MSSRRYRVDQELEIYNFRVVPDLQIRKTVEFSMFFFSELFYCFVMNEVFWRFGELSTIQAESATRDVQFYSGPRSSNKQGT